ncbi:hypothetical protein M0R45_013375 [Rubus argutus]|uniref:Nucleosome assembly protein n=1 Tax=Rubus argutus TaxID=59490 RepID=A0AAW1XKD0_RUBAR
MSNDKHDMSMTDLGSCGTHTLSLSAQFYKDRGALEAKYEKLYQPLYDKRYNIINAIEVTTDSEPATTNQEEKGVPNFWLYALRGFNVINNKIEDYDEGALKHLENIKWFRTDNLKVFKLEFHFRPNPFFKNSVLTMTYHMIDEDESLLEKVVGTKIQWYSKIDYKDLELKYKMQGHYFIGSIIRDDIIPRAILWFTGEAALQQMTKITRKHSCFLNSLSLDVKKHVDILETFRDHDGLKVQFYQERAELEANYQKLYNNIYNKRYDIVNGVEKVTNDSELAALNRDDNTNQEVNAPEEKGVPNFWRYALVNHELLHAEITVGDEEALKYLKNIKWLKKDDSKGFILEFCFNENHFLKNSVLTKTYQFLDEDETILHKVKGSEIEWYPENCLTKECESFFNIFNPLQIDENAELIEEMRRDYYIGSIIRDEIIPRAVLWYVGEAVQGDMEVDFEDSDESDEDVDEDDFENEDDRSEDEDNEEEDI